jgi:hypothetical protein
MGQDENGFLNKPPIYFRGYIENSTGNFFGNGKHNWEMIWG